MAEFLPNIHLPVLVTYSFHR